MSKSIAIITTGGTIGSILGSASVSVDRSEKRILQEIEGAQRRLGYTTTVFPALTKHSEDLVPSDWCFVLRVLEGLRRETVDGIVITHGTDTMAYTVAAALSFSDIWQTKMCFTGSYYAPDHPLSDASVNLLTALEFAVSSQPPTGIYVAFRTNPENTEAQVIHGIDLKPMWFDDLCFEGAYGGRVALYSPECGISVDTSYIPKNVPTLNLQRLPSETEVQEASRSVAMLSIYPGMDASVIGAAASGRQFLILQMYHSGTGPSDNGTGLFLEGLESLRDKTAVLMGTFPKRLIDRPYDSTINIKKTGALIFADLQPHFLYTFTILGLSLGMSRDDIVSRLNSWLA